MSDIAKQEAFVDSGLPLEDCLEELSKYGNPRLSKHEKGWHCTVEVFVTGEGVSFSVKTGFDLTSPRIATQYCLKLLKKALLDLKNSHG